MATLVIKILEGHPDGRLELSDHGHTRAKRSDIIIWQIDKHAGVKRITRIEEKKSSEDIFKPGSPHPQGGHWRGDIKDDVPDGTTYKYNIFWENENGDEERFDPIISIRPSFSPDPVVSFLIAVAAALLSIFALNYFRQKKFQKPFH